MVRAPCCAKIGMKKGPWAPEEDEVLVNYIGLYGHSNWRALPKEAGLLRCGKSCRLRWINYLRPDIKRGNFSREEEETIIELHQTLGNRWSAMAAKLPGRTDNEIKNVWHTQLKKRVATLKSQDVPKTSDPISILTIEKEDDRLEPETKSFSSGVPIDESSIDTWTSNNDIDNSYYKVNSQVNFELTDEIFWSQVLALSSDEEEIPAAKSNQQYEVPLSSFFSTEDVHHDQCTSMDEDMDYWFNLFEKAGEYFPEFGEI